MELWGPRRRWDNNLVVRCRFLTKVVHEKYQKPIHVFEYVQL